MTSTAIACLATAACFGAGRLAPRWLLGCKDGEVSARAASSACAVLVVWTTLTAGPALGMAALLAYLALDAFAWRHAPLPRDIAVHHAAAAALVACGAALLADPGGDYIENIVARLLYMEVTTPLLHAGWALKRSGRNIAATITLVLLVAAWVPLRVSAPAASLMDMFTVAATLPALRLPFLAVVMLTTAALLALQVLWLFKMVALCLQRL